MSRRVRLLIAAAVLVSGLGVSAATPAFAQDDEVFDENETQGTVESIRLQLWGIAAVTGGLLVVYIWHTDPARRQRVADRRRADREFADALHLEDEFVLPVDVEDEAADADTAPPGAPLGDRRDDIEPSDSR